MPEKEENTKAKCVATFLLAIMFALVGYYNIIHLGILILLITMATILIWTDFKNGIQNVERCI